MNPNELTNQSNDEQIKVLEIQRDTMQNIASSLIANASVISERIGVLRHTSNYQPVLQGLPTTNNPDS